MEGQHWGLDWGGARQKRPQGGFQVHSPRCKWLITLLIFFRQPRRLRGSERRPSTSLTSLIERSGGLLWTIMTWPERTSSTWARWWWGLSIKWASAGKSSSAFTQVWTRQERNMMRNSKSREVSVKRRMTHLPSKMTLRLKRSHPSRRTDPVSPSHTAKWEPLTRKKSRLLRRRSWSSPCWARSPHKRLPLWMIRVYWRRTSD